jgi:hypothetical protein
VEKVAEQRRQPEGREDGRQAEQQRDPGRDEGAEGGHQDHQSDRKRGHLRPFEVRGDPVVDPFEGARVADLADEQRRVCALLSCGNRQRLPDPILSGVRVAGDLKRDQSRPAVLRDLVRIRRHQWRSDRSHRRRARELRDEVSHRHPQLDGRQPAAVAALDQDLLERALVRELPRQGFVGRARVADRVVGGGQLHDADGRTDRERDEHEGQPAQYGSPAVCRAPAGRSQGQVRTSRSRHRSHPFSMEVRASLSPPGRADIGGSP